MAPPPCGVLRPFLFLPVCASTFSVFVDLRYLRSTDQSPEGRRKGVSTFFGAFRQCGCCHGGVDVGVGGMLVAVGVGSGGCDPGFGWQCCGKHVSNCCQ